MSHVASSCVLGCVCIAVACCSGTDLTGSQAGTGPWSSLAAGQDHTCGFTSTGVAYCWGSNLYYGALGNGSSDTMPHPRPVAVSGGLTFASLVAGSDATCGVTRSGAAYCWGLGAVMSGPWVGTYSTVPNPVPVNLTFATLTTGWCGLTSGGAAYCWSFSPWGQGQGIWQIVGLAGEETFTALADGGDHTCVVASTGAAYCWGRNNFGQLGIGAPDTILHATPVAVAGGLTFVGIATGGSHTCGLASGGVAYCWGSNLYGQVGDGTLTNRATPVAVTGGLMFTALAAGYDQTCGLARGGAAYCWGYNGYGQLGHSTSANQSAAPVAVMGGLTFAAVTVGGSHACGLTSRGAAYCWGGNAVGQLGDGTLTDRVAPVTVSNP